MEKKARKHTKGEAIGVGINCIAIIGGILCLSIIGDYADAFILTSSICAIVAEIVCMILAGIKKQKEEPFFKRLENVEWTILFTYLFLGILFTFLI